MRVERRVTGGVEFPDAQHRGLLCYRHDRVIGYETHDGMRFAVLRDSAVPDVVLRPDATASELAALRRSYVVAVNAARELYDACGVRFLGVLIAPTGAALPSSRLTS